MYINYKIKDGIEYAMVVTSVRKGSSVTKEKQCPCRIPGATPEAQNQVSGTANTGSFLW